MSEPVVLLVEDDDALAAVVGALGRRAGHGVAWRPDVPSAWAELARAVPDLLLLDVNLPGASGVELCRRVRATPRLAALPVALFTHWGVPSDVAAGLDAGADYVVSKDLVCRPDDWRQRLGDILERRRGRAAPVFLGWVKWAIPAPPAPGWVSRLNEALSHAALRRVGSEVLRTVLCRALARAPGGPDAWLAPGEARLDPDRAPPAAPPEVAAEVVAALAEQTWRLLGADARAAWEGLPGRAGKAPPPLTDDPPPPSPATEPMKASHAILLVEDNPADVHITRRALKEGGVPVNLIVVGDGREAVDYLLRRGPYAADAGWRGPDLILLDVNLPGMSGREVLERLRATPALRAVPVVVLTTSRRPEDVQEMYAAGANSYVEKPREFHTFVQVLQTIRRYWLDTALLPPPPGSQAEVRMQSAE